MVAAIINFVKARMELLKLNLMTGMNAESENYQRLSQDALASVIKNINSVGKMNCDAVTGILKLLQDDFEDTPLLNAQQVEVIREK